MRKEERPAATKLLDDIENKMMNLGTSLGLIDDSIPPVGSLAYEKLRVNMMEEDCMSMRNEPIDPLETVEDMQFDLSMMDDDERIGGSVIDLGEKIKKDAKKKKRETTTQDESIQLIA